MLRINELMKTNPGAILLQIMVIFFLLSFGKDVHANPFMNGSFEIGTDPVSYTMLSAGSTAITGWKVLATNIDYIGTLWTAQDGHRSIDLNGSDPGGIEQTFDTLAGHWYQVTFWMAGNVGGGPNIKTLKVAATGNSSQSYAFDTKGPNPLTWVQKTYTFLAYGSTVTLSIISTSINDIEVGKNWYGPKLDNVSVLDLGPSLKTNLPLILK